MGSTTSALTSNPFSEQQPRNLPRMREPPVTSRACRAQGTVPTPEPVTRAWAALLSCWEDWGAPAPLTGGLALLQCLPCVRSADGSSAFHKQKQLILSKGQGPASLPWFVLVCLKWEFSGPQAKDPA